MAKVTSKLQLTLPKRIAEQYGIAPGDEVDFVPAGDIIHLIPVGQHPRAQLGPAERQRLFDAATARQREREKHMKLPSEAPANRDWRRDDLYTRGKTG
jgi:AbrB family looped-hinge helix DNA binding protein